MVGYLNKFLLFLILLTGIYSCKTSKNISSNCQNDKIKFELLETGQLIGYEFCIPDNETVWNEVIAINPQLKKTKSKGRSNCGKGKVLVLGNTDNKASKIMLCKIANLDYVKEANQTFWE